MLRICLLLITEREHLIMCCMLQIATLLGFLTENTDVFLCVFAFLAKTFKASDACIFKYTYCS